MKRNVWLLLGDCGDYYCEGFHPVGVALSEQEATELTMKAKKAKHTTTYSDGSSKSRPVWENVVTRKVTCNELLENIP